MQILLFILKIIGIIFLILIGLILLAVGIILFVPIRYEVNGEVKEENQIEAGGVIRYLFSIFKFVFSYHDGEFQTDVYLFGRRRSMVEDTTESERLNDEDVFEEVVDKDISNQEIDETELLEDTFLQAQEFQNEVELRLKEKEELTEEIRQTNEEDIQTKQLANKSVKSKKRNNKQKAEKKNFDFDRIKKELTDEHNHNVIKKFFLELKYLLSHFKFRKIKTDLVFGAGDPALTGQILGVLSIIPMMYRYEIGLVPDFMTDEAYMKGNFLIAGRVRLIHILVSALRLIFDKEVRLVINKFMNMIR